MRGKGRVFCVVFFGSSFFSHFSSLLFFFFQVPFSCYLFLLKLFCSWGSSVPLPSFSFPLSRTQLLVHFRVLENAFPLLDIEERAFEENSVSFFISSCPSLLRTKQGIEMEEGEEKNCTFCRQEETFRFFGSWCPQAWHTHKNSLCQCLFLVKRGKKLTRRSRWPTKKFGAKKRVKSKEMKKKMSESRFYRIRRNTKERRSLLNSLPSFTFYSFLPVLLNRFLGWEWHEENMRNGKHMRVAISVFNFQNKKYILKMKITPKLLFFFSENGSSLQPSVSGSLSLGYATSNPVVCARCPSLPLPS